MMRVESYDRQGLVYDRWHVGSRQLHGPDVGEKANLGLSRFRWDCTAKEKDPAHLGRE